MKTTLLFLSIILSFAHAIAQTHYLPLSDFKFNGISGQYRDDTTTTYSLLCTGVPGSNANTDSLINTWLANHTDATLRPVCSFSYYNTAGKRVTFTYSWIVSNEHPDPSLNIYLVHSGSCDAGTMLWAKSPSLLKPSIEHYKEINAETKVFVDAAAYKNFVKELKRAHAYTGKRNG